MNEKNRIRNLEMCIDHDYICDGKGRLRMTDNPCEVHIMNIPIFAIGDNKGGISYFVNFKEKEFTSSLPYTKEEAREVIERSANILNGILQNGNFVRDFKENVIGYNPRKKDYKVDFEYSSIASAYQIYKYTFKKPLFLNVDKTVDCNDYPFYFKLTPKGILIKTKEHHTKDIEEFINLIEINIFNRE